MKNVKKNMAAKYLRNNAPQCKDNCDTYCWQELFWNGE